MFNVKSDFPIKKALYLATRAFNVKTTERKPWLETLFQSLTFTFDPFFIVKLGYLTTKAL